MDSIAQWEKMVQKTSSNFPPIFALLKWTCLVTLIDYKLQFFQKLVKLTIFGTFNYFYTQNVNVTRFARNVVKRDFFWDFQTPCKSR